MENPFRYGEVVRGEQFTGRAAERAELGSDIRSGQNVVLISPRRYGKTSLVLETIEDLRSEGVLAVYVDLLTAPTIDRLPDVLATAIQRSLLGPLERGARRAADFFGDLPLRPRVNYNPSDGTFSVEFAGSAPQREVVRTVELLLAVPGEIARRHDCRVAFVLDEFQSVVDLDPHLPATIRAIFQHESEVSHVFLGSRRHLMNRLFTDQNEPMFRMAKPLLLRPIPEAEFETFIRDRFASTKTPVGDEAIVRVLEITGCHPNDTQELCHFLWWVGAAARHFPIGPDMVEQALEQVLDAESAHFLTVWERLTSGQRALLAAVAAEPAVGVYGEDFRRRHRLGSPASIQKSLERLSNLGLLEPLPSRDAAAYFPADVFLAPWLRRMGAIT